MFYKTAKVFFEPLGTVAAIVSWNYRKSAFDYIRHEALIDSFLLDFISLA